MEAKPKTPFMCSICKIYFGSSESLAEHMSEGKHEPKYWTNPKSIGYVQPTNVKSVPAPYFTHPPRVKNSDHLHVETKNYAKRHKSSLSSKALKKKALKNALKIALRKNHCDDLKYGKTLPVTIKDIRYAKRHKSSKSTNKKSKKSKPSIRKTKYDDLHFDN